MYAVKLTKTANEQLCKLQDNIQERVIEVLDRIRIRPFHFIKRKQGTPYFILRIGEYRTILDIKQKESIIYVMEIGHRKNIYD